MDEAPLGCADGAGAAAAQRLDVAGVADRSLGPAGGRWAVGAAVRTRRGGPRCASGADRVPGRTRTNTAGAARSGCRPPPASGSRSRRCRAGRRGRGGRSAGSGRTCPQSRCGRSAHRAQNGRPCPSRPATGLTTPHRVHAARELPAPAAGADTHRPANGSAACRCGRTGCRPAPAGPPRGPAVRRRGDPPPVARRPSAHRDRRPALRPATGRPPGGRPPRRRRRSAPPPGCLALPRRR